MSLATIPDFTLAVPEAKFGYTEVKVGFVPAIAASFLLRQVGELRTRELLLSGRLLKAQEALQLGLVTQIVNAGELMATAVALAQCLLMNSPQAMQEVKRLLTQSLAEGRLEQRVTPSGPRELQDLGGNGAAFFGVGHPAVLDAWRHPTSEVARCRLCADCHWVFHLSIY